MDAPNRYSFNSINECQKQLVLSPVQEHIDEVQQDYDVLLYHYTVEIEALQSEYLSETNLAKISSLLLNAIERANKLKNEAMGNSHRLVMPVRLKTALMQLNTNLAESSNNSDFRAKVGRQLTVLSKQFETFKDPEEIIKCPAFIGKEIENVFDKILPNLFSRKKELEVSDYALFVNNCTSKIFDNYIYESRYFIRPNWSIFDGVSENGKFYSLTIKCFNEMEIKYTSFLLNYDNNSRLWSVCSPVKKNNIVCGVEIIDHGTAVFSELKDLTTHIEKTFKCISIDPLHKNYLDRAFDGYEFVRFK